MMPKFIAGIGNYLRAEIFYDSGIDPFCKLEDFTDQMLDALYESTHRIIKHSYKKIKADSYINFKVYGREKCPKGNQILHIDRKGRRLWYCPNAIKFHCKK
jgi:formamidopyrimidine-DNA glycosylase